MPSLLGLLAWAGWQPVTAFAADDVPKDSGSTAEPAGKLAERGIAFLAAAPGCQRRLVDAARAGDHGAGRDRAAPLRPGRPWRAVVTKALAYLEGFITPKGGLSEAPHANYSTSIALLAFREANTKGRYDRTIKAGQEFLKTMQWDESEGKTPQRRVLRRGGIWRHQQPARPVEHRLLHRRPARDRPARRRSQPAKGDRLCLALPEPEERVQRPTLVIEGQRRRFRLHGGQRRAEHGRAKRPTAACARMPA